MTSAAPADSPVRVLALPQPSWPAWTRPQVRAPTPAAMRTSAGTSSREAGPRLSASRSRDPAIAAMPTGTFTQKIQCQFRPWVTAPPISGPLATARPATPPQIPITVPRRSAGNAEVSNVRPSGMMIPAPIPSTARNAIRAPMPGASAQAADATVKTIRPEVYIRRRPIMSPSAAAVMMVAPNAST